MNETHRVPEADGRRVAGGPAVRATLRAVLAGAILIQTAGCGTLIYPERRGQTSGRIDAGVAILDGVGLLLFIIPGLIAYAIDFSTGAIYLPPGRSRAPAADPYEVVRLPRKDLTPENIEAVLWEATGRQGLLDHPALEVRVVETERDLPHLLVQRP